MGTAGLALPLELVCAVYRIVLSSRIRLLAPIRVTKISTAGGSALADSYCVTHGIVILADSPPSNSPHGNRWCAKRAASPSRLLCAAPPLHSLLGAARPTSSVTARIVSTVASGLPPSAERPTHPKRSCFLGLDREATASTAR